MSSRLAVDAQGRLVCVVTVASESLQVGQRFLVVDMFELGFARPGRPPTARERMKVPDPYGAAWRNGWEQRAERDDDSLADEEAIRLARLEQQRRPVDLIARAA